MADGTPTDKFLQSFERGRPSTKGVRPFRPTQDFHQFDRDIYGLVEFPSKVMITVFQEVFARIDKWRFLPDVLKTNIYIQDRYPQSTTGEAESPALRPAIITDRGTITVANVNGRSHNRQVTPQQGENGLVTFQDLVNCPMTIHCLAPDSGIEAERIASIVFGLLVIDEMAFKRRGIHAILSPEIGSEGPIEQLAHLKLVNVPVSFTMQYAWAWARRPDGDPIESLASLVITDP